LLFCPTKLFAALLPVVKNCKIVVTIIINKQKTRYQRKLTHMNKLRLFAFLLLSAFVIQSCKKNGETAVAYSTANFQANINGTTWAPDTISNTITYNSTAKTKVFNCMGTKDQKQVIMTITLNNASNGSGFSLGTFNVDSAGLVAIKYNTQQKNSEGNYVFLPHGTVTPGSGSIIITAIDSVKRQITGTFSFYSRTTNYDDAGNVISIDVDNIFGGEFNGLPYNFTNN